MHYHKFCKLEYFDFYFELNQEYRTYIHMLKLIFHQYFYPEEHSNHKVCMNELLMRLPVDVESDAIDARLESGVLTITLPKIKPARSRRVTVRNA